MCRTVYFSSKDRIFSAKRPYIFKIWGPYILEDRIFYVKGPYIFRKKTVYFQFLDRIFSVRTVYFTCDPEFWSFLANLSFIESFMSLTEHWAHSHSTPWFDVMVEPFASISFDCFVIAIIRTKRFNPIFSFFGIVELGD